MIDLLLVIYSPWQWMPATAWAAFAWLAVAIRTALVVSPLLRRNRIEMEARDGR